MSDSRLFTVPDWVTLPRAVYQRVRGIDPIISACSECFAYVAAPEAHAEWHKALTDYLTDTRLEAEAPSTRTDKEH